VKKMKWSFLSGDGNWEDHGGKFISPPQSSGEFTYWFVLEVINWEEAVGEREAADIDGNYNVSLSVVAPSECPIADLKNAMESCGLEDMEIDSPLMLVEILYSYGIHANVWNEDGCLKDLMQKGKQKAIEAEFMFGFAMDKHQNAIGATGWDFLQGNPLGDLKREAS